MLGHFLYFVAYSTRNRARRQFARLRSPRYAIAALVGLGYFYLIFGRPGAGPDELGAHYVTAARGVGPILLGLLAAWWWLWGGHRAGLVLTPAETHLLVPAPITRRSLVRLKILQAQIPIAFSAALGALLTRGAVIGWPLRFASLWLLLATLHLHQIAASLVHAAADEQGRRGIRRNIVALALFGAGFTALAWSLARAALEIRAAPGIDFAVERLGALIAEPVPRVVLLPFRLLLDPLTAASAQQWLPAFGIAAVVLVAHYLWVQRTDAAFEEVAAAEGEKRDTRARAVRSGGVSRLSFSRTDRPKKLARPLLPLPPTGRPEYAVLWKNLLFSQRLVRARTVVVLLVAVLLFASPMLLGAAAFDRILVRLGFVLLVLGALVTAFGPLAIRNDLRMDLASIEALRTYPLKGRSVVAAEIAAATLIVILIQQPLVLGALALLALAGAITAVELVGFAAAALVVLPAVAALAVLIQNALALLYPGWIRIGAAGSGGMEAVGQNLLTMIGTLLLIVLIALPPLVVGAAVAAPFLLVSTPAALMAGLAGAVLAAVAELVLLVLWLGGLYDRTDPVTAGLLR